MLFITDEINKVIFGWSAKSGCSHIKKIFWYLKTGNENHQIHIQPEYDIIPDDSENYTIILFVRNPYERLVSGFLDCYRKGSGGYYSKWKESTLTFSNFVEYLLKDDWDIIDRHHFTPIASEFFNENLIKNSKEYIIYDIKNIDYKKLETIYNKTIPPSLIAFKGDHIRKETELLENPVYNLDMELYFNYKVPVRFFYNKELKQKVYDYFKFDFEYLKKHGFDYDKELILE